MRGAAVIGAALLVGTLAGHAHGASGPSQDVIRLGVIATEGGPEATRASWTPLAEYLTREVGRGPFVIVPLAYDDIDRVVAHGYVEFVLVNPGIYVDLEVRYGTERMATIQRGDGTGASSALLGSTVIRRADRPGITGWTDLEGKRLIAVHALSFGGWMAAWREMQDAGLRVPADLASLQFGGTQDAVIAAVRAGRADVGVIAAGTLESRLRNGVVAPGEFAVVAERPAAPDAPDYPFRHSTRLYPEYPIAQLKHTPNELAVGVAAALLQLPASAPAAGALNGSTWTLPGNYQSVRECLMALRVRPFEDLGKVTLSAALAQYWPFLAALGVLLACVGVATGFVLRLNRRLAASTAALQGELGERQRAEASLRESEQKFRAITASAKDAIVMMDDEGRVVFWNHAAEAVFGHAAADVLGQDVHRILAPARYEAACRAGLATFAQTGTGAAVGATLELAALRNGGREFPVELSLSALQLGGRWHAVGIARDITERKRVHAELEQARDAADAANRAKSDFLANMSHEIRTPMNAVIGLTGLLLDTPLTQEQRDFTETIRRSGDSLLALINDILDFSKVESGKLDLESHPFAVGEVVESAVDLLCRKAGEKGLDLSYEIDPAVPGTVIGDATRVRQVLVNLVSNAIKFTAAGKVAIAVHAAPVAGTEQDLTFAVRDTGIGIAADRMDRLFKTFSQVDASTTRQFGGTGLGLAISRQLVEMMGGRIWVDSVPGEGSTFSFTLRTRPAAARPNLATPEARSTLAQRRVLVVVDDRANREILVRQMAEWGIDTTEVDDGPTALAALGNRQPFDLAVIDVHVPPMDGCTLAAEIRKLISEKELPLLMLTSAGANDGVGTARSQAELALFAGVLTKPVKTTQLRAALLAILNRRPLVGQRGHAAKIDHDLGRRRPLRILLAEDNVVNQRVAVRMLERLGYRADVAANGREAVDAVARHPYDVVLMDVHMPEMDGLAAAREISRRGASTQRPRIIAMTADAMHGDREKCLAAGMDDYLTKPVHVGELQEALDRCGIVSVGAIAAGHGVA